MQLYLCLRLDFLYIPLCKSNKLLKMIQYTVSFTIIFVKLSCVYVASNHIFSSSSSLSPLIQSSSLEQPKCHLGTDTSHTNPKQRREHCKWNFSLQPLARLITHLLYCATEHKTGVNINQGVAQSSSSK